ncbi:HVO_A0114 family putative DNA-binding protein [Brenneria tiliae]|uniref:HVO_A0114 family putative DNA-binding protein n=1 Tax=Brenneria tiliae TaxID=2914984 RepID=UPI003F68D5C1
MSTAEQTAHAGERETPIVCLPSLALLAVVLSNNNRRLRRRIHDKQPKSLTGLAELCGRKVPNIRRKGKPAWKK